MRSITGFTKRSLVSGLLFWGTVGWLVVCAFREGGALRLGLRGHHEVPPFTRKTNTHGRSTLAEERGSASRFKVRGSNERISWYRSRGNLPILSRDPSF